MLGEHKGGTSNEGLGNQQNTEEGKTTDPDWLKYLSKFTERVPKINALRVIPQPSNITQWIVVMNDSESSNTY
jgi:hypothetical protein